MLIANPTVTETGGVDVSVLTSFEGLGGSKDRDLVVELIDLYLKDGDERVRTIKTAVIGNDVGLRKHAAHTLRGSSASLGFNQIVEICKTIEQLNDQNAGVDQDGPIELLQFRFAQVRSVLLQVRQARLASL
jgi:HPt (histidine-containing phosphotransfer) domain-containing protein